MVEADMVAVLHLIPDCMCLAMIPQTSEVKGMLEELIPEEDIPEGGKFAAEVSHNCLFTYDQKDMIVSLFDDVSIAHEWNGRIYQMIILSIFTTQ